MRIFRRVGKNYVLDTTMANIEISNIVAQVSKSSLPTDCSKKLDRFSDAY